MRIPHCIQITMDDLGWFCGTDDRLNGGPARSGMPRRHRAEDYAAINELGRCLNMKINCAFILGEWDPDNRLKTIPYLSKYADSWDNVAHLDREEAERCAEVIRSGEYIDIAVHGLLHNYFKPGIPYGNSDYYYRQDGKLCMTDEGEIRRRLDAYFDLVSYYHLQPEINSFIPPTFAYRLQEMSPILKDYGILYASTIFEIMEAPEGVAVPEIAGVDNGIITVDRKNNMIPWNEVGADPRDLPVMPGIFGCHWPNALHADPARHGEIVEKWVSYFRKCADTYGVILSRDIGFCATQSLYVNYAMVTECDGGMTVDIRNVPKAAGLKNEFYISTEKPLNRWTGCDAELYETHTGFMNYKITPRADILTFC